MTVHDEYRNANVAQAMRQMDPNLRARLISDHLRLRYSLATSILHEHIEHRRAGGLETPPSRRIRDALGEALLTTELADVVLVTIGARSGKREPELESSKVRLLLESLNKVIAATEPDLATVAVAQRSAAQEKVKPDVLGGLASLPNSAKQRIETLLARSLQPCSAILACGTVVEMARPGRGNLKERAEVLDELVDQALAVAAEADSYRTYYNAACLAASVAERSTGDRNMAVDDDSPSDASLLRRGLDAIERGFASATPQQRVRLTRSVSEDPSLDALRRSVATRAGLAAVLRSNADSVRTPDLPPALADVEAIGPEGAAILSAHGVTGPGQLEDREMFAWVLGKSTGASRGQIDQWLDALDLLSLPGLTAGDANALAREGIRHVRDLAQADPFVVARAVASAKEQATAKLARAVALIHSARLAAHSNRADGG